jgi:hypothetical protein
MGDHNGRAGAAEYGAGDDADLADGAVGWGCWGWIGVRFLALKRKG